MRGVSVEYKGYWHKFECGMDVMPGDGESVSSLKAKAWATVEQELELKLEELKKGG